MRYFRLMVRANEKRATWGRLTSEFERGSLASCFVPVRCAKDATAIVMATVRTVAVATFA